MRARIAGGKKGFEGLHVGGESDEMLEKRRQRNDRRDQVERSIVIERERKEREREKGNWLLAG